MQDLHNYDVDMLVFKAFLSVVDVYLLTTNNCSDVLYLKAHVDTEQFECLPRGLYEEEYSTDSTTDPRYFKTQ